MHHSCVEVYAHIIFCTKGRKFLIPQDVEGNLYSYMAGIARRSKDALIEINGTLDHVHILVKLHPENSISKFVKELKSYSTSWMKKEGIENFCWQRGYAAFSCSKQSVVKIAEYVRKQKQHHAEKSFVYEMAMLSKTYETNVAVD